jgi:hypothetical protein
MTRRRRVQRPRRELAVRDGNLGPTPYDLLILAALETWARTGKKPKNPKRFEVGPEVADLVLGHLSAKAFVVQSKALDQALSSEASHPDVEVGVAVAKNILDRHLGRPVERTAVAGKVQIEFQGLHPESFPTSPKAEAAAEIVEIAGDAGTHVDDDGDGD